MNIEFLSFEKASPIFSTTLPELPQVGDYISHDTVLYLIKERSFDLHEDLTLNRIKLFISKVN